jgi:hypothetical protein
LFDRAREEGRQRALRILGLVVARFALAIFSRGFCHVLLEEGSGCEKIVGVELFKKYSMSNGKDPMANMGYILLT